MLGALLPHSRVRSSGLHIDAFTSTLPLLMYAVVRTGGKQYRVEEGSRVRVERLGGEVGELLQLDEVLMLGGENVRVGQPIVAGASVTAEIVAQDRAKKIIVFKFKRRKNYRRKAGHRQAYTELKIRSIQAT